MEKELYLFDDYYIDARKYDRFIGQTRIDEGYSYTLHDRHGRLYDILLDEYGNIDKARLLEFPQYRRYNNPTTRPYWAPHICELIIRHKVIRHWGRYYVGFHPFSIYNESGKHLTNGMDDKMDTMFERSLCLSKDSIVLFGRSRKSGKECDRLYVVSNDRVRRTIGRFAWRYRCANSATLFATKTSWMFFFFDTAKMIEIKNVVAVICQRRVKAEGEDLWEDITMSADEFLSLNPSEDEPIRILSVISLSGKDGAQKRTDLFAYKTTENWIGIQEEIYLAEC